jgi:hypothetical protein
MAIQKNIKGGQIKVNEGSEPEIGLVLEDKNHNQIFAGGVTSAVMTVYRKEGTAIAPASRDITSYFHSEGEVELDDIVYSATVPLTLDDTKIYDVGANSKYDLRILHIEFVPNNNPRRATEDVHVLIENLKKDYNPPT